MEREISLKDQEIEEEELERGREVPEKEEETKREGSEEEFQAEDEESEEFGEEAEQQESRKKKRKKKKGRYSAKLQEPTKPFREAIGHELKERNRKETPIPEPYRVQETAQYGKREEPYHKRENEYNRPGSDKKDGHSDMQEAAFMGNQAGTVNHPPTSGHTAQKDGFANADRNRVTDFHDRTRTEGESREETIQSSQFVLSPPREGGHAEPDRHTHQKGKSRYPDDTSAPDGRENGSREKWERPSARSVVTDSPSYARKERSDRTKLQTSNRQTASADQTVFLGNSSSLPDSTYSFRHSRRGCLTSGNGMSIPSNRMMDRMDKKMVSSPSGSGEHYRTVNGQSQSKKEDLPNRSKRSEGVSTRRNVKNMGTSVKEYSSGSDLKNICELCYPLL